MKIICIKDIVGCDNSVLHAGEFLEITEDHLFGNKGLNMKWEKYIPDRFKYFTPSDIPIGTYNESDRWFNEHFKIIQ